MEGWSGNRQWLWWVLSLLLLGVGWLFHPWSTAAAASVPVLPVEGTYTDLSAHWDGTYRLTRVNDWVTATFSTTRSPVQYSARQRPTVLFTMPSGFRPAQAVTAVVRPGPSACMWIWTARCATWTTRAWTAWAIWPTPSP